MARKLTCYMPGIAAVTPTSDWCEFITIEYRCEASSRRDPIYGSACGRWCFPNQTKHAILDMWSGGGEGGGSCCCMQGGVGQGGQWTRNCISAGSGINLGGQSVCYVVAHGGCCRPNDAGFGCFSMFGLQGLMGEGTNCACQCGGAPGKASCYRFYCCYSRDPASKDVNAKYDTNNVGVKPQTNFTETCRNGLQSYNYGGGYGGRAITPGWSHGRMPWISSNNPEMPSNHKKNDGWSGNKKNNIYIGSNHGRYGPWCDDMKQGVYKPTHSMLCSEQVGEYCAHSSRGVSRSPDQGQAGSFGKNNYIPWVANECYTSCNDWQCGTKHYTTSGSGRRGTQRYINFTNRNNSRARGGWEHNQWHLCHNGSNNNLCFQNIRTVGFGGKAAHVCGGPCCCGGWGSNGAIIIKYKGGIKDDHGDKGRWG